MFAPALANTAIRLLTREGFSDTLVRLRVRESWRSYLTGWLAPPVLVVAEAGGYFAVFPDRFGGVAAEEASLA